MELTYVQRERPSHPRRYPSDGQLGQFEGKHGDQDHKQDGNDDSESTAAHVTLTKVCAEPSPHLTVIGQLPVLVFAPTFHVQLTLPAPSEVFVTKPAAVEGPDL